MRLVGGLCAGAVMLLAPFDSVLAQGRLDARYEAKVARVNAKTRS